MSDIVRSTLSDVQNNALTYSGRAGLTAAACVFLAGGYSLDPSLAFAAICEWTSFGTMNKWGKNDDAANKAIHKKTRFHLPKFAYP